MNIYFIVSYCGENFQLREYTKNRNYFRKYRADINYYSIEGSVLVYVDFLILVKSFYLWINDPKFSHHLYKNKDS